jgi:hypothetical protein
MFYGDLVEFKEGEGFEVGHDWIAGCNSDLEEFDYHDSAWDTEGFDEEEYKEAIKELLTSENEVSNPNDWERQK